MFSSSPKLNGLASGFRLALSGKEEVTDLASLAPSKNKSLCSFIYLHSTNSRVVNESATNGGHCVYKERRSVLTLAAQHATGSCSSDEQISRDYILVQIKAGVI